MIDAIKIQNLRSLKDTGWIHMKPLTILVGKNSSGKSTFLRWFPLMAQSLAGSLRVPILWFDNMVDFGDFATSISKLAGDNKEIIFSYNISRITDGALVNPLWNRYNPYNVFSKYIVSLKGIKAHFHYSDSNKGTFLSKVHVTFDKHIFVINFDPSNSSVEFNLDGETIKSDNLKFKTEYVSSVIPKLVVNEGSRYYGGNVERALYGKILGFLQQYCHNSFSHVEKLVDLINRWEPDENVFLEKIKKYSEVKSLAKHVKQWTVDNKDFRMLNKYILLVVGLRVLDIINEEIYSFFRGVEYVAPLRAPGQRYFRNKGLQVAKIDSNGNNLGEYIDSLTPTQRASYDSYLDRTLGIKISVRRSGGHQSLEILKDNQTSNLTDVGFGYSQILPILTKMWIAVSKGRFRTKGYNEEEDILMVIEQPELHLHPAMQGKLADAFMKIVLAGKLPSVNLSKISDEEEDSINDHNRLIIETHSPTIINRIGRRIREGHMNMDDVQVLVFNKKITEVETIIEKATFGKDGQLENWPFGFLDPEDEPF